MKVMTILGTRPELIKLSRTIVELDKHYKHILVHTGQNYDYELNGIFFNGLGIRRPDYFLDAAGTSPAETVAKVISASDAIIAREIPDALLILGDTNSCMAAYAAKRRKIPIFHIEAGNRCFDQRVPEEINRKIIDHISDVNLVYTEHARRYLLSEGIRPDLVIKIGSPMKEVLHYAYKEIEASSILDQQQLQPGQYFVLSCHREENIDNERNFSCFVKAIEAISSRWDKPIIFSVHPRTRHKLESTNTILPYLSRMLKPLGFHDYIKLQQHAFFVLSDSGTLMEEASLLSFPAASIRHTTERPEGMDEGTVVMCGLNPENVIQAVELVLAQRAENALPRPIVDYEVDNVSLKVARIIHSYTGYVNRVIWSRDVAS